MKSVFLLVVLLGLWASCEAIHAQVACPPGWIPYSADSCGPDTSASNPTQQTTQQTSTFQVQPRVSGSYAGLAVDRSTRTLSIEYGRENFKAASRDAMQACKLKGGNTCELVATFTGLVSVVIDADDHFFVGKGSLAPQAIRQAFSDCNKQSKVGWCLLIDPPVMSGMLPPNEQLNALDVQELLRGIGSGGFNIQAISEAQKLAPDLAALSQRMDTRDYWGATAADGESLSSTYNQPDQRTAESKALKGCESKECRIAQVFKNSCVGIAWPKDKQVGLLLETAVDTDPLVGRTNALAQCTRKHGACDVQVRCSGRKYPSSNPEALDSASRP